MEGEPKPDTVSGRILAHVRASEGPAHYRTIAAEVGGNPVTVRAHLNQLALRRLVHPVGDGRFVAGPPEAEPTYAPPGATSKAGRILAAVREAGGPVSTDTALTLAGYEPRGLRLYRAAPFVYLLRRGFLSALERDVWVAVDPPPTPPTTPLYPRGAGVRVAGPVPRGRVKGSGGFARILAVLQGSGQALRPRDIARGADVPALQVGTYLRRLLDRGLVVRVERGTWVLTPDAETPTE